MIVAGLVLALAGLFLLEHADRQLAVWGGLACAALGIYARWQRQRIIQQSRPPLPVVPRFERVKVYETLNGKIVLGSDGKYQVAVDPVAGQIDIVAIFSKQERERLDRYREKHQLSRAAKMPFHAGFAVPRGPSGWKFADDQAIRNPSGFVIPLRGMVDEVPFFTNTTSRAMREWPVRRTYDLLETPKDLTLPIRLVPSLFQARAQRVLELELQWVAPARSISNLSIHEIASLELRVPISWGDIQLLSDSALVSIVPNPVDQLPVRSITWTKPALNEEARQRSRRTFMIQFEHTICLNDIVAGHMDVVFKNALSGVEDIDLYYPLGGRRSKVEAASVQTKVGIDFELSLAGLRYQDIHMIPDAQCPQSHQPQMRRFEQIVPDHLTIVALTDAICQQNFMCSI